MTDRSAADEEILCAATAPDETDDGQPPEVNDKADDTLELGGEDAPELTEEQKAEAEAAEKEKKRGRPWQSRVDNLTARLRDAERRLAESEAGKGGTDAGTVEAKAPDPNDEKYEFGEADPAYLRDIARFEVQQTIKEERARIAEEDKTKAAQQELTGKITEGMARVEKAGAEKYDDFEKVIGEAIEARGGEPLHPMVSIGIAVSPAGEDIAYRMATDEAVVSKIERLAQSNPQAAAIAFGELEGEYLESDDDADLDPRDPLDMARMLGRERARRKGLSKPVERKVTKATAPERQARGGTGQFEVADDTEDFAAFERKYMGKK